MADGHCVLAFVWPCRGSKAKYAQARADAMRAAPRLHAALCALRAASCDVTVVAHSLGARVALQAVLLEHAPARCMAGTAALPAPPLVQALVLIGAAVDAASLGPGREFDRSLLSVNRLVVLYSRHDDILRSSFPLGEALSGAGVGKQALGLVGAIGLAGIFSAAVDVRVDARVDARIGDGGSDARLSEASSGIANVDVSASVGAHGPNVWLLSPPVMAAIAPACSGTRSLSDLDVSSASMSPVSYTHLTLPTILLV